MRPTIVVRYIGLVFAISGIFIILSGGVGALYGDGSTAILLVSGVIVILFGLFPLVFVPVPEKLSNRESLAIVGGAWVLTSIAGALPFLLYGSPFTPVNAIFESISGFTTTGSSILPDIESLPKGLLFWRSCTHFLGGTGIIIFMLAIVPALGSVSPSLFRSEFSGVVAPPALSRAAAIARVILLVYIGLNVAEIILLCIAGLSLFDAVTTAFGTIATGGFSPRNESIGTYGSLSVEMIVLGFMVLSGINFAFLYSLFHGWWRRLGDLLPMITAYLVMLAVAVLLIATQLAVLKDYSWGNAFRFGSFQAISVGTSAGYATDDSSVWPVASQLVIVFLSLVCACAGSTSGGIKFDRIYLFGKLVRYRLKRMVHPHLAMPTKGGMSSELVLLRAQDALLFISLYLFTTGLGGLLLALFGVDMVEALTGAVAAMGNVGPGLGAVGSMGNYTSLPDAAKLTLAALMLIGRLEIYGLVLLFTRSFWTNW